MAERLLSRRVVHGASLFLMLGLAAALRLYGTSLYHPDERMIVDQAKHMVQDGSYMPRGLFNYPSFYPTLQAVVNKYLPKLGKGIYGEEAERTIPLYYLRARVVTAFMGTLTVLFVYLIGRSLGWPSAGLAGAAFLAVSLNHVENSHYASVDVPMTFNVTLAFLFTCMHYKSGKALWAVLGGAFCGLAIGTKYNAALILVPFVLSMIIVAVRRGGFRAWLAVIAGVAAVPCGFLLACPYFLSMSAQYIQGLRHQIKVYSGGFRGHDKYAGPSNWVWNAIYLWRAGMGGLPMILSLCGCLALLLRERARGWLVVSFPLVYYVSISLQSLRFSRNLAVLTPFLSLMAGYALWRLCVLVLRWTHKNRASGAAVIALLIAGVFWQPFLLSFGYARMMGRVDPRSLAIEWAESNISKGSKIAVDFLYGPRFSKEVYGVTSNIDLAKNPLTWYLDQGYDYIVTSSGYVAHWFSEVEPEWTDFYRGLKGDFKAAATFSGNELGLNQDYYVVSTRPTITIYDLHSPLYSGVRILSPVEGSSAEQPSFDLRWSFFDGASGGPQKAYHVDVDRYRGGTLILEAEDLLDAAASRKGWERQTHILGYRGDGSLGASRSAPPLESSFSLDRPDRYYCWVRYQPRHGGVTKITVGKLSAALKGEGREIWQWERLGKVKLPSGESRLVIDHAGERFTIVDAFILTTDSAFNPRKDALWVRALDTGEVYSSESSLPPSWCSKLEPGLYRARVRAADTEGRWGPWSSPVSFRLVK